MQKTLRNQLIWLALILTGFTSWAAVGGMTGGVKVKSLSGSVQVEASKDTWRPLGAAEALSDGQRLRLAEKATLVLLFRFDGHREVAEGPGDLVVGRRSCQFTGAGNLQAFDYRNRPVAVTTSGNIGVVGGRVERTRGYPPIQKPITQPVPSVTVNTEVKPPVMAMAIRSLLPPQTTYGLHWDGTSWLVDTSSNFAGIVQVEDLEEGKVVASRAMEPGSRWTLENLDLQPGRQYRVRGGPSLSPGGGQTFRALSAREQADLRDLQIQLARTPQEHLQRMDQFAQLGLFHQAVREGEALLLVESPQVDNEAILQAVYDLHQTVLQDKASADYWLDWGRSRNFSVQP